MCIIIIKCNIHPTFGVLYKKAPQTPQMGCNWGAKTSSAQDTHFCGVFEKIEKFDYPHFFSRSYL